MPVYEISGDQMVHLSHGRLADLKKGDRKDFLALLRENIQVLSSDLLLVSNDSDQWNKSEEIDLLAIDKNSNLVVVEVLEAGSKDHENLPIVRYGTLASKFTFGNLVETYQAHLQRTKQTELDAKKSIINHWGATLTGFKDEELLDLRIIFVSRAFTDEMITTVDWIRNHKLDIRCIQMSTYEFGDRSIIDIDQLVPKIEGNELAKLLQRKLNPVVIKPSATKPKPAATTEATPKPDSAKTDKIETNVVQSKPSVKVDIPESNETKPPVASPKVTAAKSEQQKTKTTATKSVPSSANNVKPSPAATKATQSAPMSTPAESKKPGAKSTSKVTKDASTKSTPSKPASKSISANAKAATAKSTQTKTSGHAKKSDGAPQLDRARYYVTFNGVKQQPTAKRRVVLQTITHLIKNGIKPNKFPERIAGTDDIFICVKGNVDSEMFIKLAQIERKKVNRTFDSKRYFCRDDELIKLGNQTYAVINQWTLEGFKEIMNLLKNDYPKFKINYRREEK